jgi:hypothetical protein
VLIEVPQREPSREEAADQRRPARGRREVVIVVEEHLPDGIGIEDRDDAAPKKDSAAERPVALVARGIDPNGVGQPGQRIPEKRQPIVAGQIG